MFDLPTFTKTDRDNANHFRNFLKDNGFEMSQFSVYTKFVGLREKANRMVKKIKNNIPPGKVSILFFTDKQFSQIISIHNNTIDKIADEVEQLMLF
jgi:CRISPR-associated protein Cas2